AADRRDRGGDQAAEGGTGHRQRAAATGAAALVRRGLVVALVAVLAVLAAVTGRGGRRGRRGGRRGRLPVIVVLAGDGDLRQLGRSTGLAGGDGGVAALLGGLEGDRAGAEHDLGAVAGGELAVQVVAPALLLGEGVLGVPGPAGAHRDRLGRRGAAAQVDVAGDGQAGDVVPLAVLRSQVEVAAALEDALVLDRVAGVVGVGVGPEVPLHRAGVGVGSRRG